jgi:hypothetical protein
VAVPPTCFFFLRFELWYRHSFALWNKLTLSKIDLLQTFGHWVRSNYSSSTVPFCVYDHQQPPSLRSTEYEQPLLTEARLELYNDGSSKYLFRFCGLDSVARDVCDVPVIPIELHA